MINRIFENQSETCLFFETSFSTHYYFKWVKKKIKNVLTHYSLCQNNKKKKSQLHDYLQLKLVSVTVNFQSLDFGPRFANLQLQLQLLNN